ILHTVVQEYIIDNQHCVKEPIGMSGVRLDTRVHNITGANTALQNIQKCIQSCGMQMHQIMIQPISSGHSEFTEDEKDYRV
ncbi:cell division protein FtsA, partial [Neisseria sp. P0017.S008]